MSDFVQTMKDWRRMCRTMEAEHPGDGCNHCPLLDLSPYWRGCNAIYSDEFADNVDWRELEKRVTKWVAEHPEPVYPTWFEWLEDVGIVSKAKSEYSQIYDTVLSRYKMFEPIPADIAEKLGIEPKEG